MAGGSVMSVTADGMLLADKWLKAHPTVKDIVDGLGKGASAALWLKYAKTVGPAGFLTGLVVDYGYDKLIENFHLDTAKEHFAAYLLSKDSDLNKEQADILASAAIKVTKEAGRILTHKMAANGVQGVRKYFTEKGPKVFKAPEVQMKEGAKPASVHTQDVELKAYTEANFRYNLGQLKGTMPDRVHAHHIFPQKHKKFFTEAGLNINDPRFGVFWESTPHLQKAKAYNNKWTVFWNDKPNATIPEILAKGREMMQAEGVKVDF